MKSVVHSKLFQLQISVDELFPLFSPEGETLWVPGWEYTNVMGTTELSEDYVFLTANHDHGSTDAVWLVKRYDPQQYFVQFYKVEPGEKVGVVTVQCSALAPDVTEVQVGYKYTALSASGEAFIRAFDKDSFDTFIGEWESLLVHYFNTLS